MKWCVMQSPRCEAALLLVKVTAPGIFQSQRGVVRHGVLWQSRSLRLLRVRKLADKLKNKSLFVFLSIKKNRCER